MSGDEDQRTTAQSKSAKTKEDQVAALLKKTVENGATRGEETSAIQLAHMLVRQHHLDIDAFKAALAKIGDPPRYAINVDGFLVPTEAVQPTTAGVRTSGPSTRWPLDEISLQEAASTTERCPTSPTGKHRFERFARGTLVFGNLYCVHCGIRE